MEVDVNYEPEKKYPKQLSELLEMGFDKTLVLYALHTTSGKVVCPLIAINRHANRLIKIQIIQEDATHLLLDPQPWYGQIC